MSRYQLGSFRVKRISRLQVLLVLAGLLWIAGVLLLQDLLLVGVAFSAPGFAALLAALWQSRGGSRSSLAAWICCGLGALAFLLVVALGNIHLHELSGAPAPNGCGGAGPTCISGPAEIDLGLLHAAPFAAFLASGITLLAALSLAKRFSAEPR